MALWVYASVKTWEDGGSNLGTANFFWTRQLEKRRMVRLLKQKVRMIEKRSMQRREDDGGTKIGHKILHLLITSHWCVGMCRVQQVFRVELRICKT